ncbi:MAG TPA: lipid-binding SYLF domain-containing protein [Vicinamibacterales bacterium]|nr:lipid-binding SYLF domain-containing protein [Vicinamibacterales bacterium]
MARRVLHGAMALVMLSLVAIPIRILAQSDEAQRVQESVTVFNEIMAAPDKAIPNSVLNKTEGIAVFPGTIKGGFVIGAQHGRGILSARNTGGWSAPAFMSINGGSIGAQIGASAVDVVLVVMSKHGLQNLVSNEFKMGADAGVAAGPVGRDASASTDASMRAEILTYSRSRGLFAGVTLNGASISSDDDADKRFYGKPLKAADIIFQGLAGPKVPSVVKDWQSMLARFTTTTVSAK